MSGEGTWAAVEGASNLASTYMAIQASKKAMRKQIRFQRELAQNQIQYRVADAKAAGIHPLAALGISPASGQIAASVPDFSGISEAGHNFGQALSSLVRYREEKRANDLLYRGTKAEVELKEEQLRRYRRENNILIDPTISTLIGSGQMSGALTGSGAGAGAVVVPNEVPASESRGLQAGPKPWTEPYFDTDGSFIGGPTMEGAQKLQADWSVKLPYYMRKFAHGISNTWEAFKSIFDIKGAKEWYDRETARMPKLPKGWIYVYHPLNFSWEARPGRLPSKYFRKSRSKRVDVWQPGAP